MTIDPDLQHVSFDGKLRPSQVAAIDVIRNDLDAGKRRLHIVAPPGSGKTVLGLYVWAELIKRPALVFSPNTAIQSQWLARLDLFNLNGHANRVSSDSDHIDLFTSLTYQSATMPGRGGVTVDASAITLWRRSLVDAGTAADEQLAQNWIDDLASRNPDYFEDRLSSYRKRVRDAASLEGDSLSMLHASALNTLHRARKRGIGLIILDECHHLVGHWGRVLSDAHALLDGPVVLGLTATPPEEKGKAPEDVKRYRAFFGPIDYQVPVPALVKDGNLAPFQDLAYFVRPTARELAYIADSDQKFHEVLNLLCQPHDPDTQAPPERALPLTQWVPAVLGEHQLPTGAVDSWREFEKRDERLAMYGRLFLTRFQIDYPESVPPLPDHVVEQEWPELTVLAPVLDRYIRHALRRSRHPLDHQLAEDAIARLHILGMQITETGSQACASPISRVMAYSAAKTSAVVDILRAEIQAQGRAVRAIVVSDFEKTSATHTATENILDPEAGGAIAAFRALLAHEETDALDPILVTGSTVLVDDDLLPRFLEESSRWLADHGYDCALSQTEEQGFYQISGKGQTWCPKVYVAMITDLFQRGITSCLVGTRGLLGEGWDANKINVLVDLTSVTTSMSVNQLRGRSIRIDPDDPVKVANNWDVICIADEFAKGLDDYDRFKRKHRVLYGVTDDGAIEKGAGHVHPAFSELKPEGVNEAVALLNEEMVTRAQGRAACRTLWRIGEPFQASPTRIKEVKAGGGEMGFSPFAKSVEWSNESLTLAIGHAVLGCLKQSGMIDVSTDLSVKTRGADYVRVFLQNCEPTESDLFLECVHEALGPLHRPRYVIQRFTDQISDTWISNLVPELIAKYFRRRRRLFTMLHAIPAPLARNKELVALYQAYWNKYVSPGEAFYAYRGHGAELLDQAKQAGQGPQTRIHGKDVFL